MGIKIQIEDIETIGHDKLIALINFLKSYLTGFEKYGSLTSQEVFTPKEDFLIQNNKIENIEGAEIKTKKKVGRPSKIKETIKNYTADPLSEDDIESEIDEKEIDFQAIMEKITLIYKTKSAAGVGLLDRLKSLGVESILAIPKNPHLFKPIYGMLLSLEAENV